MRPHAQPLSRAGPRAPGPRPPLTLWERLPPPNRQRLVWLLGHLLERQLARAIGQPEEVSDEPPLSAAPR